MSREEKKTSQRIYARRRKPQSKKSRKLHEHWDEDQKFFTTMTDAATLNNYGSTVAPECKFAEEIFKRTQTLLRVDRQTPDCYDNVRKIKLANIQANRERNITTHKHTHTHTHTYTYRLKKK